MKDIVSSKVTSKYQACIPQEIRQLLNIEAGDTVIFEINQHQQVIIKKAQPIDALFLRALTPTLSEWESSLDEEDYASL